MNTETNSEIISLLEREMYKNIAVTGRDCEVIIMNPQTWEALKKEVSLGSGLAIDSTLKEPNYREVKVYRTLDIEYKKFIIR